jgi:hypothetical protein
MPSFDDTKDGNGNYPLVLLIVTVIVASAVVGSIWVYFGTYFETVQLAEEAKFAAGAHPACVELQRVVSIVGTDDVISYVHECAEKRNAMFGLVEWVGTFFENVVKPIAAILGTIAFFAVVWFIWWFLDLFGSRRTFP